MKKNILKSILITNFVIMLIAIVFGFVESAVVYNYHCGNVDEGTNSIYIDSAKSFEADFSDMSGDDRYIEVGKTLYMVICKISLSNYSMLLYAFILSIFVGTAIGYIITVSNGSYEKKIVIKKLVIAYLIGALLVLSFSVLMSYVEQSPVVLPLIAEKILEWTVVFAIVIVVTKVIDNKKAKSLKEALKENKANTK